jgi:hypothetical protein
MTGKQNNGEFSLMYVFAFILYGVFLIWIAHTYVGFTNITIQSVVKTIPLLFIFVTDLEFLTKRYLKSLSHNVDPRFDNGIKAATVIYNLILAAIFIFFNSMSINAYIIMLSISTISYLFIIINMISISYKKSVEEATLAERKNRFSNNQLTK